MPSVGPNYVGSNGSSAIAGATWASLPNAEGSTTGTYATWTSTTRSATATWQGTGFGFTTSTVPAGSIFISVDVVVRHLESSTTILTPVTAQLFKSGTAIGSAVTLTGSTTVREDTFNVPASTTLTTADLPNLQVRVVGTRTNTTTSTTLSIDSARITVNYGTPTATDSYSTAIIADAPVGYWRLGDTGTTAIDSSGYNHDSTLQGGVTTGVAGGISGSTDTAMTFNGSTGYISVPRVAFPADGNTISLECWFRTTVAGGLCGLMTAATPGGTAPGSAVPTAYIGTSGGVEASLWYYGSGLSTADTSADYRDGNWHHAVITYSGGVETVYVNGVQKAQRTGLTVTNFSTTVYLGVAYSGGVAYQDTPGGWFWLNGSLDEVAVYNVALTATQVLNHYNAGAPAGGVTYPVTLSATAGSAASVIKNVGKLEIVARATSAVLLKQVAKTFAVAGGSSSTLGKAITKTLAVGGGSAATLAAIRAKFVTLVASAANSVSLLKQVGKSFVVTAASTSTLRKAITKILAVSDGSAVTLTAIRAKFVTLVVAGTSSAALLKQYGKNLVATSATNATLSKNVTKVLTVARNSVPILAKAVTKIVAAGEGSAATVTALKARFATLSVSAVSTATLAKQIGKSFVVGSATSSRLTKTIMKALAVGEASTATASAIKTRFVTLTISAASASAATLATVKGRLVTLTVTAATNVSLRKQISKALVVQASSQAGLSKTIGKAFRIAGSVFADLASRFIPKVQTPPPASRTYAVEAEDRRLVVEAESRVDVVEAESRVLLRGS